MIDVVIYHNPACETSRNVLAMIRNSGIEPHIIEYLKSPPTRLLLTQLIGRAGLTVRQILREKGTPFHDLGLSDLSLADDALLDAIGAHPILINRPLVVTPKGVRLCRPSESGSGFAAAAARSVHQGRRRARDRRSWTARRNGLRNFNVSVRTLPYGVGRFVHRRGRCPRPSGARRISCDRRGGDRQGQSAGGGADLAHDRSHADQDRLCRARRKSVSTGAASA